MYVECYISFMREDKDLTGAYKLRQVFLSNGDRLWLLVDFYGMPDYDAARYLSTLYQGKKSLNTLRNIAYAIRVFKRFVAERRINIKSRLLDGRILTLDETMKLIAYCGQTLKEASKVEKVVSLRNGKASKSVRGRVENNTQRTRAYYAGEFVGYLVERETELLSYKSERKKSLISEIDKLRVIIQKYSPKKEGLKDNSERALTQDEVKKIMALTAEEHSELAALLFKQPRTRKRNLLIIELALSTGVRVSELARLRIENVDEEKLTVSIKRDRELNSSDVRRNRPGFKTRERLVKVNGDLMRRLCEYMNARKGGRPKKALHRYIFCANGPKANALSLSSFYRLVRRLEIAFGDAWERRVKPHDLRNTFFDIWFREADEQYDFKNNPELFAKVVSAAEFTGGWCPDSEMVNHYQQRFVFEQASELTLGTQLRMKSGEGKGKYEKKK